MHKNVTPVDNGVLKNILCLSASLLLFFIGVVIYGIIINLREVPLAEAVDTKHISELDNVSIIVERKHYRLELYSNDVFVKSYKAVFGMNRESVKTSAKDNVTPIGTYHICTIDTNYEYYKFLQLSYPNIRDASEAYKTGYIDKSEFDAIVSAVNKNECPPADTKLGANIGIHGIGEFNFIFKNLPFIFNWTNGSIAVSNECIDDLLPLVKIGTKVIIIN